MSDGEDAPNTPFSSLETFTMVQSSRSTFPAWRSYGPAVRQIVRQKTGSFIRMYRSQLTFIKKFPDAFRDAERTRSRARASERAIQLISAVTPRNFPRGIRH